MAVYSGEQRKKQSSTVQSKLPTHPYCVAAGTEHNMLGCDFTEADENREYLDQLSFSPAASTHLYALEQSQNVIIRAVDVGLIESNYFLPAFYVHVGESLIRISDQLAYDVFMNSASQNSLPWRLHFPPSSCTMNICASMNTAHTSQPPTHT